MARNEERRKGHSGIRKVMAQRPKCWLRVQALGGAICRLGRDIGSIHFTTSRPRTCHTLLATCDTKGSRYAAIAAMSLMTTIFRHSSNGLAASGPELQIRVSNGVLWTIFPLLYMSTADAISYVSSHWSPPNPNLNLVLPLPPPPLAPNTKAILRHSSHIQYSMSLSTHSCEGNRGC